MSRITNFLTIDQNTYNVFLIKWPLIWAIYVFSSFPPPSPLPPRPPPQQLFPLTSKPFELNLRYLTQRIYDSGERYWMTFRWPWTKVTAVASINNKLLVCAINWEPLISSLQNLAICCSSHGYYLIRMWRSSVKNFNFDKFSLKISDVFFEGRTLFWPDLRDCWSDWCETKKKCIGSILGTICDLDFWPQSWPWPWMFQGQISK